MIDKIAPHCRDVAAPFAGVYFLVSDNHIVYVGQSDDIAYRISLHRLNDRIPFDRAIWLVVPDIDRDAFEGAFIRALTPKYNKSAPRDVGRDEEILTAFGIRPGAPADRQRQRPARFTAVAALMVEARAASGATQRDIAKLLDVSDACVCQYERGYTLPRDIIAVADAYGIDHSRRRVA